VNTAENKKLVQDAFTEWGRGNGDAFFNLLAVNVRWTVIGSTKVSGTYYSREVFLEKGVSPFMDKLAEPIVPTVRDIIAQDDKVVVQWEGRAFGKNDRIYYKTYCYVLRLRDGKIQEGTSYLDTEQIARLLK
jgi:uncharacterized protein